MRQSRLHHILTAWLATIVILLGLFAPALSQALAMAETPAGEWREVCTQNGFLRVNINPDETLQSDTQPKSALSDSAPCLYCTSHASTSVLPTSGSLEHSPPPEHQISGQKPGAVSLRSMFDWPAATPRGPPATAI